MQAIFDKNGTGRERPVLERQRKRRGTGILHRRRRTSDLARARRKLLPKNCVLKYAAPFEDKSGLLPDEVLIDEDLQHVENVQENFFNFLALKDGAL